MSNNGQLPVPSGDADGTYHLYALRYAAIDRRAPDNFVIRDVHDGPMPLDYNLWIACNARRTILIDTGFGPEASGRRHRPRIVDPIDALVGIGIDVDLIDDVLISHLHYDHAGNMARFARARFHVQDQEGIYATGRCMGEQHLRAPYDVEDVVTFVRQTFADRIVFHDGDASPLPGISLHLMPGHTAGMQAVSVETPRGRVLLASDVSHYYANLIRRSPFVLTIDAAATLDSYARLLDLAGSIERIIPGHDPLVRRYYPSISVGGVELSVLHEPPTGMDADEIAGCAGYEGMSHVPADAPENAPSGNAQ